MSIFQNYIFFCFCIRFKISVGCIEMNWNKDLFFFKGPGRPIIFLAELINYNSDFVGHVSLKLIYLLVILLLS